MRRNFTSRLLLLVITTTVCIGRLHAQMGIGTTTPSNNAMLDVNSTSKGILLPRLTAAQQTALTGNLGNGQRGMLVTDATSGKPIVWMGSNWKDASGLAITASLPLVVSATNTISINPGTAAGDLITWDGTNWVNRQPAVQHFSVTADNRQPYLAINYCIGLQGIFPSRSSLEPFLGEIDLFAFGFAPKGYAQCNGQLLAISQNTALFSLLGTFYGGDGRTNFALPNLQGRVPVHTGINGSSTYIIGQTGGVESNTITH